jgi:hypothetical protein
VGDINFRPLIQETRFDNAKARKNKNEISGRLFC